MTSKTMVFGSHFRLDIVKLISNSLLTGLLLFVLPLCSVVYGSGCGRTPSVLRVGKNTSIECLERDVTLA